MTRAAAKTAIGPPMLAAIEQSFPEDERIIEDDVAYRILPPGMRSLTWLFMRRPFRDWMVRVTERDAPGIWGGMMCRKRYIEEKLAESVEQLDAVVNLGAGFDTLAYRLHALADTPVWEVDQPQNIGAKRARLRSVFGEVPNHVELVPVDFDRQDLGTVLEEHGYTPDKRTFFVCEAVTQYLTESGIRETFRFLSQAARGSRLAATYVLKDFLEGNDMCGFEKGYKQYVASGLWIFGMDPGAWPGFLDGYGWRLIEDVGYDDMADRYVKPTGRTLTSTPVERMFYAEKV